MSTCSSQHYNPGGAPNIRPTRYKIWGQPVGSVLKNEKNRKVSSCCHRGSGTMEVNPIKEQRLLPGRRSDLSLTHWLHH